MALWNYPLFDLGRAWPRDRWNLYRHDPLTRLAESSIPTKLSTDLPTFAIKHQPIHTREVVSDPEKYQVTLQLRDFKCEEINVKLVDRDIVICAQHEEKPDEHGHVLRNIKRSYILPRNVDYDHLKATFSDDGTLVVCAQKKAIETEKEREIEVKQIPPAPETKSESVEAEKGNVNMPVNRETAKN